MGSLVAKATMPILAAGNPRPVARVRGFTLLELLMVLAIVAFASLGVAVSMRDGVQMGLEREALRLAAVLESARARSQASGVAVRWRPVRAGFVFEGLPPTDRTDDELPGNWQEPDTQAEVLAATPNGAAASVLVLGPEPIIEPQSVALRSRSAPGKQVVLSTDGVRPFAVRAATP